MYVHFSKCVMWQFEVFVKGLFWASGGLFLSPSLFPSLSLSLPPPRERERERGGRGGEKKRDDKNVLFNYTGSWEIRQVSYVFNNKKYRKYTYVIVYKEV